jgi:hypothetical protein
VSHYDASGRQPLPQEGEWIPANPPIERPWVTMREAVAIVNPEPHGALTVKYDEPKGELTIILFSNPMPSESSLLYLLADERKRHPIKILTFVISNARLEENLVLWFQQKKFNRSESKYTAGSMIAFSKSYVKESKDSEDLSGLTGEEKLARAKASVRKPCEPQS